jgi:hypothetical protein
MLTRRRHKLPPPPDAWFNNLAHHLGERLTIHLVWKDVRPVASILTLSYKNTIVYKYGCSDLTLSNLGGTPYLFWRVIQQAKEDSMVELDLGRSAYEDPGLITFKEHLGAASTELTYFRGSASNSGTYLSRTKERSLMREMISRLPDPMLAGLGALLYRHIG